MHGVEHAATDESGASPVTVTDHGDVALVTMDDGKANALGFPMFEGLAAALDDSADAGAVVVAGRPGQFSAGFDLKVMAQGGDETRNLLATGVKVFLQAYLHHRPVVAACTGHAVAAGALILMSCDERLGADGDFRIGMPELAIGMPLPYFAAELMRERLSPQHLGVATMGRMYDPAEATKVGYLDEVVNTERVLDAAVDRARAYSSVGVNIMRRTRVTMRGATADAIRTGLADDLSRFDRGS